VVVSAVLIERSYDRVSTARIVAPRPGDRILGSLVRDPFVVVSNVIGTELSKAFRKLDVKSRRQLEDRLS
jgi:hypothetical protein